MPESFKESRMSKVKSHIVKGDELYEVALELGFGEYLMLGKGELVSGGRQKRSLLANVTEALIGAVYVEAGFDEADALVLRLFKERLREAIVSEGYNDFKSELQEATQERFSMLPEYTVVSEAGPEHEKTFVVEVVINGSLYGRGQGGSKKEAHQAAAKEALQKMQSD